MLTFVMMLSFGADPIKLPDAVRAAVEAKYPKATVKRVEEEHEHQALVYEVTLELGAEGTTELSIDPAGKLLSEERIIAVEKVAPAVRKAFAASAFSAAKVERIEKVIEGSTTTYEFVVRDVKGKRMEVVFDEGGTLKKSSAATE